MSNIAVAALMLLELRLYIELVVWGGVRQDVRTTWFGPWPIRRALSSEKRRPATFDRRLRRFLDKSAGSRRRET